MTHPICALVLAHDDPAHVRRLTAALAPAPVVLHCDARTDDATFAQMVDDPRVVPVPRRRTPWGSWAAAAAELDGIRTALSLPGWAHLVVLQGSDYPLHADLPAALARYFSRSVTASQPLPRAAWGGHGGLDRLRYRHWVVRKHMVRLPVPRRLPAGVVPAGGSVNKVLTREHAALLVALADARPELARFWRRSWNADETFVPTLLQTALADLGRAGEIERTSLWFTDWGTGRRKSPAWLTEADGDALLAAARAEPPVLFARKFGTARSGSVLDRVDAAAHRVPA